MGIVIIGFGISVKFGIGFGFNGVGSVTSNVTVYLLSVDLGFLLDLSGLFSIVFR